MNKRRTLLLAISTLVVGGLALASTKDDLNAARALTRDGATFGWSVRYLYPPDPCIPPDPCKAGVALTIDADTRTDLDQQVVFRHSDGSNVNPCVRVLHQFLGDGSMAETINVLDPADAVLITVPAGYQLVAGPAGYVLAPASP